MFTLKILTCLEKSNYHSYDFKIYDQNFKIKSLKNLLR